MDWAGLPVSVASIYIYIFNLSFAAVLSHHCSVVVRRSVGTNSTSTSRPMLLGAFVTWIHQPIAMVPLGQPEPVRLVCKHKFAV
jgi:hypothetical protein